MCLSVCVDRWVNECAVAMGQQINKKCGCVRTCFRVYDYAIGYVRMDEWEDE